MNDDLLNHDLLVQRDEKIFELTEEITRLRGQVTYLQEELYLAEDKLAAEIERSCNEIADLEQQLGEALFRG